MDEHTQHHLHESPLVVTLPLLALAIPSVIIGAIYIGPMLFHGFFGQSIFVLPQHDVLAELGREYQDAWHFTLHGIMEPPFWFAVAGILAAWFLYLHRPELAGQIKRRFAVLYSILDRKYGFDEFNDYFFAGGGRGLGRLLWQTGDVKLIDGLMVNGTARSIGWFSSVVRHIQSGYLYHYAFAIIIGLMLLLGWPLISWIKN